MMPECGRAGRVFDETHRSSHIKEESCMRTYMCTALNLLNGFSLVCACYWVPAIRNSPIIVNYSPHI